MAAVFGPDVSATFDTGWCGGCIDGNADGAVAKVSRGGSPGSVTPVGRRKGDGMRSSVSRSGPVVGIACSCVVMRSAVMVVCGKRCEVGCAGVDGEMGIDATVSSAMMLSNALNENVFRDWATAVSVCLLSSVRPNAAALAFLRLSRRIASGSPTGVVGSPSDLLGIVFEVPADKPRVGAVTLLLVRFFMRNLKNQGVNLCFSMQSVFRK